MSFGPEQSAVTPDSVTMKSSSCNSLLKLGDSCDSCSLGIMLPVGGFAYYEGLAKLSLPSHPRGHLRIVCTKCGHWHNSIGPGFSSGPAR